MPHCCRANWNNVALIATLPSVTEILVVDSTKAEAQLLRRGTGGFWPENPALLGPGEALHLESIELTLALAEAYRGMTNSRNGRCGRPCRRSALALGASL